MSTGTDAVDPGPDLAEVAAPLPVRAAPPASAAPPSAPAASSPERKAPEPAEVAETHENAVSKVQTLRVNVDTLEHLRRGGRIGTAAALFATSLSVKPLLQMVEGQIVPLEKVRTSSRAVARLVELTVAAAGDDPVDLAVHHLGAADRARTLADELQAAIPHVARCVVAELGAVIGAHLGPGVLGTVLVRRQAPTARR